ncbi:hypothetical protein DPMN_127181 [Dreissena polymorpha]|uniref:G-protein coupled receptors family 1 profile domain-containing protein n=1 Tax=Dreissena polymorpha TaxID=45954 RepID=A0A9D4JYL6_DREPO|nr:hypothetical protein DPMN_127181 [Dreissena polymorpha]
MAGVNDSNFILMEYNKQKTIENIPVIVLILSVCYIGALCNAVSFNFYRMSRKMRTSNFLLASLSFVDCFACLCLSLNTVTLFKTATFESEYLCKLISFTGNASVAASVLLVFLICVDRLFTICLNATKLKLTLTWAKFLNVGCYIVGMLNAIPDYFLTDTVDFDVIIKTNLTVTIKHCTDSRDYESIRKSNSCMKMSLYVAITLCLIVMYSLIARKVNISARRRDVSLQRTPRNLHNCTVAENDFDRQTACDVPTESNEIDSSIAEHDSAKSTDNPRIQKSRRSTSSTLGKRITFMTFLMTVVSIVSLTPYCVIKFSLSVKKYDFSLGLNLLYHTYIFNNFANPFIIGYCNTKFRAYGKGLFFRMCMKKFEH